MGTNSKTTHHAYVTAPTAPAAATPSDAAPLEPGAAQPTTVPDTLTIAGHGTFPGAAAAPLADLLGLPSDPPPAPAPPAQPEPPAPLEDPAPPPAPDADADPAASGASTPGEQTPDPPDPWADAVTPLPETLAVGQAFGTPAMVGGLDLADSAVTVMSYADGENSREVLMATVTPEAEAQLLDALSISGVKMVPVETVTMANERLQADVDAQLAEKIATAAKSANHNLKHGQQVDLLPMGPALKAFNKLTAQADALESSDPQAAADLKAMLAHYGETIDAIYKRADGAVTLLYTEGGKIPHSSAYTQAVAKTVTSYQPAPIDPTDLEPGTLPATTRTASRIAAGIDTSTGTISWNGAERAAVSGTEYAVDLGDGYQAVYRPHQPATTDAERAPFSMRGQLEIIAPPGQGHSRELVSRLGQLNLGNTPAGAAEAEWAYLKANVTAQSLGKNSQVAAAMGAAAHLDDLHVQELFHTEGHRAVGLDADGLHTLAREFQTRAAAAALPAKVALLRESVAAATGHASGEALAASPGYQPSPASTAGWLSWSRFDVTGDGGQIAAAWKGKSLVHHVTGENLAEMLRTGAFGATERRRTMGLSGHGLSEGADMHSGGANSVFLRVKPTPKGGGGMQLVWDDPVRLMAKTNVYGYNGDKYGVLNPEHASLSGMTRDPKKIAGFTAGSNEVMIGNGLDLLGQDAPTRILAGSSAQRAAVLKVLTDKGVTHLGGKPVADVVTI